MASGALALVDLFARAQGPASAIVLDLLGGLRSACTYIGASTIREMPRRTTFVRVTQQLNQVFGSTDLGRKGG